MATEADVAENVCDDLIDWVRQGDANCIATTCPLCQANLDVSRHEMTGDAVPVPYFTRVLAFALGCDIDSLGLEHHLIDLATKLQALPEKVA